MAEDEPRHGDTPEHGPDPGTTDQPEPAEPETRMLGSDRAPEGQRADDGPSSPEPPTAEPPAAEPPPTEPEPPRPGPPPPGLKDTAQTPAIGPDDATAVHPVASDPWAETAPPVEPTDPRVGPSGTTIMPSVPGAPPPPGGPETRPRWSARAQVPQAESDDTVADGEGYYEEEPPGRALATPILVGLAIVALLVAIGFGGWLVIRGLQGATPTPPAGTTRPPATTPPPTTATTKPSPTVTTTTQAAVAVPNLNGQDYAAAANTLTGLGLVPQRVNESSSTVPAGKVIRTDPNGGFALTGNTVTVVVSSGPPASPSPSPSPTPKKS